MEVTPDVVAAHGITPDEYQRIEQILGRAPNYTELGIFSVMWSVHRSYHGNILVNVFALGVTTAEKIFKGTASGVGNPVIYVGSKTGRDGIHGATMASAEFDEASEEKRPTVQVGDPFTEKLLLEAWLG